MMMNLKLWHLVEYLLLENSFHQCRLPSVLQAFMARLHLILRSGSHPKPSQTLLETFQNRTQIAQDAPKRHPIGSRGAQDTPKSAQGTPKRRPRNAQERPRGAQERPRHVQETPKPSQNRARGIPRARIRRFWGIVGGLCS